MPSIMPSRRSLLAGAAGITGAALLSGCSDGASPGAEPQIPLERRMRDTAVRDSGRLLERYDATIAAHPALAGRLAPLRASVAAHTEALASADGASPSPSRSATRPASPSPSSSSVSGAPATAPAAAGAEAVPPQAADALTALADAERSLAEARTISLAEAPGELARMLASVAACGHVHAHLLTAPQGASS
ncbi:lipoprotein [Streptomyces avidinii]